MVQSAYDANRTASFDSGSDSETAMYFPACPKSQTVEGNYLYDYLYL